MDRFYVEAAPSAENKTYVSGQIRLSIITDHILRLERVEGDTFADLATQKIMHRDFGSPSFSVKDNMLDIEVTTADRVFHVDKALHVRGGELLGRQPSGTSAGWDISNPG